MPVLGMSSLLDPHTHCMYKSFKIQWNTDLIGGQSPMFSSPSVLINMQTTCSKYVRPKVIGHLDDTLKLEAVNKTCGSKGCYLSLVAFIIYVLLTDRALIFMYRRIIF